MKIIALGHQKGVGKSTVGRFLHTYLRTTRHGSNIQRAGFADKMKDICSQLYFWDGMKSRQFYEDHPNRKNDFLPRIGKSVRQIWIEFGTLVGRQIYVDTWTDYLLESMSNVDILIITDLRFPSEIEKIRAREGFCVKVERPSISHTSDLADDPLLNYEDWDYVLKNDGDFMALNQKIYDLLEYLHI